MGLNKIMFKRKDQYKIAIIGATGMVGRTFLNILAESNFPVSELRLVASSKSVGLPLIFKDKVYLVEALTHDLFNEVDLAFFCAGRKVSEEYALEASNKTLVIDNTSAFRKKEDVPLIIPEVNFDDIGNSTLIANPNCSTIPGVMVLKALDQHYGVRSVNYATYQAVSGSGLKGIIDLENTIKGNEPQFYPYNIALTCIPEIDAFLPDGYTIEEEKMIFETKKILKKSDLLVSATCVRVPIRNCHGVLMRITLDQEFDLNDIRLIIKNTPGLILLDDGPNHLYPTAQVANNTDFVYVGRIRRDKSQENGLLIYALGDNLRRGAATNALKIAELIHQKS